METIRATTEYGIVVRRNALLTRGVSYEALLEAMDSEHPFDIGESLISFGPSFGEEAMHEFVRRLEAVGLENYVDFCTLTLDLPPWCQVRVSLV